MNREERLERMLELIEELKEENFNMPIIVEGKKDVKALKGLGIKGEIIILNTGDTIFHFCETYSKQYKSALIFTDWDKKGGNLCWRLREGFSANEVKYNDKLRGEIARLSSKEIKCVEALPKFIENLRYTIGIKERLESVNKRK